MPSSSTNRRSAAVVALCFAVLIFDGYDLIIYGATVPDLLAYQPWHLTTASTGLLGSLALFGIVVGALGASTLAAKFTRRKAILISLIWFSCAMALTAAAPSPWLFGAGRVLAGLGLGAAIPSCITVTADFSRGGRKNLNNAIMFSGYAVGGIFASLLALALLPHVGFRVMFAFGAVPLLLVPILLKWLPESPADLIRRGRTAEAAAVAERYGLTAVATSDEPVAAPSIWRGRTGVATVFFCLAGVFGQLLIYGMNTWLPQIMRLAGYSLSSSLAFLVAINTGAIVGSVGSAPLADRFGARSVAAGSFAAAMIALVVLGVGGAPTPVLLVLVAVVGFGSIGSLTLLYGFIGIYYPAASRAAAMSATFGIARIGAVVATLGGGGFLALNLPTTWNFLVWVLPALLGAVAVLTVPAATADRAADRAAMLSRERG